MNERYKQLIRSVNTVYVLAVLVLLVVILANITSQSGTVEMSQTYLGVAGLFAFGTVLRWIAVTIIKHIGQSH